MLTWKTSAALIETVRRLMDVVGMLVALVTIDASIATTSILVLLGVLFGEQCWNSFSFSGPVSGVSLVFWSENTKPLKASPIGLFAPVSRALR